MNASIPSTAGGRPRAAGGGCGRPPKHERVTKNLRHSTPTCLWISDYLFMSLGKGVSWPSALGAATGRAAGVLRTLRHKSSVEIRAIYQLSVVNKRLNRMSLNFRRYCSGTSRIALERKREIRCRIRTCYALSVCAFTQHTAGGQLKPTGTPKGTEETSN